MTDNSRRPFYAEYAWAVDLLIDRPIRKECAAIADWLVAHLLDHVFPSVPVRQWVLSLPHRIRYLLAWDHALCRAVVGVYMRTVLGFLRRRARRLGVRKSSTGLFRRSEAPPSHWQCSLRI